MMRLTLCNADLQRSEICIIDGAFAWQTVQKRRVSSSESSTELAAAEAFTNIPRVDLSSDEDAVLVHEAMPADDTQLTLMNINFTVPKVFFIFRFFRVKCWIF